MSETIDIFRQFPEMKRDNAGLQEFSAMLANENGSFYGRSGFLCYYNKTTDEIIPSCDRSFTLRNAQVKITYLLNKNFFKNINYKFFLIIVLKTNNF